MTATAFLIEAVTLRPISQEYTSSRSSLVLREDMAVTLYNCRYSILAQPHLAPDQSVAAALGDKDQHVDRRRTVTPSLRTASHQSNPRGSYWLSGWCRIHHATRPAMRALSKAFPRRRALCTNWKKPR